MRAIPTWFGPASSSLFGWLHVPAGEKPTGAVILCPPLGREFAAAHRSYRRLAERLAASGICALRFDYAGTGDSAPVASAEAQVDAWIGSVIEAARYLRESGAPSISLVGLRLGATIAAAASADCGPLASVVLWDPCQSGSAFLREQRALQRLAFGKSSDGADSFDLPWLTLPTAETERMRALRLDRLAGNCPALLLLHRDGTDPESVVGIADRSGILVGAIQGQPELLDVPTNKARVPVATVESVVDFVKTHARCDAFELSARIRKAATVGHRPDGQPIIERIESFGQGRLFGLVTGCGDAPPVLFLNVATDSHIGPGALWVTLSREIAALGHQGVRFDLTGLGDSPVDDFEAAPLTYLQTSVADVLAVARAVSAAEPSRVVLVGLCSGAWTAAMAARTLGPRAAYLINPLVWRLHPRPIATAMVPNVERAIKGGSQGARRVEAMRSRLRMAVPEPLWRLLGRLGLVHAPWLLLAPCVARGTDIRVLYGVGDGSALQRRPIGHLRGSGAVHILYSPLVDHALLTAQAREEVRRAIRSWLAMADAIPAQRGPVRTHRRNRLRT